MKEERKDALQYTIITGINDNYRKFNNINSLVYQLVPHVLDIKYGKEHSVIVASPLASIIKQQLHRLGDSAVEVTDTFFSEQSQRADEYDKYR